MGDSTAKNITLQEVERLKARLAETPGKGRRDALAQGSPRSPANVNCCL